MLGDFTRRAHARLEPGADVLVQGPYGRFNPILDPAPQVWIAGGIGITPFLSSLRSLEPDHCKTIDLFYFVRDDSEALYVDEIEQLAARDDEFKLHLFRSDVERRLNAEIIAERVPDVSRRSIYFCGPYPMLRSLIAGLRTHGMRKSQWHYEEFALR